ncbi:MAG: copper homeostasis periplasmic binding protein CopC [Castellaniella sp.]|nr:copper homeostasis periplasmic binding protein CopC [Castellaniella sp.]
MHTAVKTAFSIATATGLLLVVSMGQAWAHAHPVQQTPAPDTTISAPGAVTIVYTEPIEAALSRLNVLDAQGKQVNTAKAHVTDSNHKSLEVALPKLSSGHYKVQWAVVADDGHRSHGSYTFAVK